MKNSIFPGARSNFSSLFTSLLMPPVLWGCVLAGFVPLLAAPASRAQDDSRPPAPPAPPALPADAEADPVVEADGLMKKRGLPNCKRATELYRAALQPSPGDATLQMKTADAINCVMRIRTNGNSLLIKGTSDTAKHKKIWAEIGEESHRLAKAAYEQQPNDLRTLAVYTDAYMFHSASYGILKAITKGAATQYLENARALVKRSPRYDGGLGYIFLGAYYLIAPWPLSDRDKAKEHMDRALSIEPKSRRNNYYVGVVSYRQKDYPRAAEHFKRAIDSTCPSPTERDFCRFMEKEATRGLALSEEKMR